MLLLQGAQMFLTGERSAPSVATPLRTSSRPVVIPTSKEYGFCTEMLIRGQDLSIDDIRQRCEELGSSVLVVGEPDLIHLHVHTERPGDVMNFAADLGTVERVKVENMQVQHTAFLNSRDTSQLSDTVGVVAVAAGSGLGQVFRDLGALGVVPGGQTMNPSIEELVHGISHSGSSRVILLPNNPNVLMTAQQAQDLAGVSVRVVPTRTVCEGVAAMVAFNPDVDLEANVAAMTDAAATVQTVELTRAVRSTRVNGLKIKEGQIIGLLNGVLVQAGKGLQAVATNVLEQAAVAEHEVVTIYYGAETRPEEAKGLAEAIAKKWPDVQVEVIHGGQPHYPFIISVE